jgi:hypothetical protein
MYPYYGGPWGYGDYGYGYDFSDWAPPGGYYDPYITMMPWYGGFAGIQSGPAIVGVQSGPAIVGVQSGPAIVGMDPGFWGYSNYGEDGWY